MLNTRELESRWVKYKIKSFIPHVTIIVSSIIIITVISILVNSDNDKEIVSPITQKKVETHTQQKVLVSVEKPKTIQLQQKIIPKDVVIEISQPIVTLPKENILNQNESFKLSPSLDFMKKMQHSSLPYYQNEPTTQELSYNTKQITTSNIVEEVQHLEVEETTESVEDEVHKISITRRDASDDIRHIIKRFKKNNNPALSLFVAKKYYELGDYHKAYNYALITNQIDRGIDASWIIFAKSLVKLKQKDLAIKTLKEYTKDSPSSSAQILLDEITSGKFK